MRLLILVLSILSIQAQAQEYCYPELYSMQVGVGKYICFSSGSFEVGEIKRVYIKQNGMKIDEFEATVISTATNYEWNGGGNCIGLDYPTSSIALMSSQRDYSLKWQVQYDCRFRSQGWIVPAN